MKKYEVRYAYTFNEVISNMLSYLSYGSFPKASNKVVTRTAFNVLCGVTFPDSTAMPTTYVDSKHTDLLNLLVERYWDEYVFESPEEYVYGASLTGYPDIQEKTRRLVAKLCNILQFTYPKYKALLDVYTNASLDLTAKLEKTSNGSATTRNNDTPQDSGDFDDDSHTSFISQGTADNTESWDNESLIERLDKINKLYLKTMGAWLNEFQVLFIEGGNYHEI